MEFGKLLENFYDFETDWLLKRELNFNRNLWQIKQTIDFESIDWFELEKTELGDGWAI